MPSSSVGDKYVENDRQMTSVVEAVMLDQIINRESAFPEDDEEFRLPLELLVIPDAMDEPLDGLLGIADKEPGPPALEYKLVESSLVTRDETRDIDWKKA